MQVQWDRNTYVTAGTGMLRTYAQLQIMVRYKIEE